MRKPSHAVSLMRKTPPNTMPSPVLLVAESILALGGRHTAEPDLGEDGIASLPRTGWPATASRGDLITHFSANRIQVGTVGWPKGLGPGRESAATWAATTGGRCPMACQTASMQAWEPSGARGDTCAMGSTVTEAHHFVSSPGAPW